MKMIDKKPSLIEDKVMISVKNLYFCDIEGSGKLTSRLDYGWIFTTTRGILDSAVIKESIQNT